MGTVSCGCPVEYAFRYHDIGAAAAEARSRRLGESCNVRVMDRIHGRCSCGAVQLELVPPTLFASYCHCESCRRAHAAPFVAWTAVPCTAFRSIADEAAITEHASSPGVVR